MPPTIVSKQGLGRTLAIWAGSLRAAPTAEANATIVSAVTLVSRRCVAAIDATLATSKQRMRSLDQNAEQNFLMVLKKKRKSYYYRTNTYCFSLCTNGLQQSRVLNNV